jgi:hypothetical protein
LGKKIRYFILGFCLTLFLVLTFLFFSNSSFLERGIFPSSLFGNKNPVFMSPEEIVSATLRVSTEKRSYSAGEKVLLNSPTDNEKILSTSSDLDNLILTKRYEFESPEVLQLENGYGIVVSEELENSYDSGKPIIPFKTVRLLIPSDKEIGDVEVIAGNKIFLNESVKIKPAGDFYPLSLKLEEMGSFGENSKKENISLMDFSEEDSSIYQSSFNYPLEIKDDFKIQVFHGYTILLMNIYPVVFVPSEERVFYYDSLEIKVKEKSSSSRENSFFRTLSSESVSRDKNSDRNKVLDFVDNEEDVFSPSVQLSVSSMATINSVVNPSDSYDYVIITNNELKNSNGEYTFQDLASEKNSRGVKTTIVSVEEILNEPQYYCDGKFGDGCDIPQFNDTAARIRNFIKDAYQNWGIEYVLLGGDGDGGGEGHSQGGNIIPSRGLYAKLSLSYLDSNIPSDHYYAALDGSFNSNLNELWGESFDGIGGKDVDLLAEVYVGRAPVSSEEELSNFVRKTLSYQDSFLNDDSYLRRALFVGEYLGFGGVASYAKNMKEQVRVGGEYDGYYTQGFTDSFIFDFLYERDGSWNKNDFVDKINSYNPAIINHLGHANVGFMMKLCQNWDAGSCEEGMTDVNLLENTKYFVGYSQGCYAGSFDNRKVGSGNFPDYHDYDSIAEDLVSEENGAVAMIANSRYGWGMMDSTDGPSQRFDRRFFDAVFGKNIPQIGKANQDSKTENINLLQYGQVYRWVFYGLNLFGDPELTIKIPDPIERDLSVEIVLEPSGNLPHAPSDTESVGFRKNYYEPSAEVNLQVIVQNRGIYTEKDLVMSLNITEEGKFFNLSEIISEIEPGEKISFEYVYNTSELQGDLNFSAILSSIPDEEYLGNNYHFIKSQKVQCPWEVVERPKFYRIDSNNDGFYDTLYQNMSIFIQKDFQDYWNESYQDGSYIITPLPHGLKTWGGVFLPGSNYFHNPSLVYYKGNDEFLNGTVFKLEKNISTKLFRTFSASKESFKSWDYVYFYLLGLHGPLLPASCYDRNVFFENTLEFPLEEWERPRAEFTGNQYLVPIDSEGNGLYDGLDVVIELKVNEFHNQLCFDFSSNALYTEDSWLSFIDESVFPFKKNPCMKNVSPGIYNFSFYEASLYGGNYLPVGKISKYNLDVDNTKVLDVSFSNMTSYYGDSVFRSSFPGGRLPAVAYESVRSLVPSKLDFNETYDSSDFELPDFELLDDWEDLEYGLIDEDGNGLSDYVYFDLNIFFRKSGNYTFSSSLPIGYYISRIWSGGAIYLPVYLDSSVSSYFEKGKHKVRFLFNAEDILIRRENILNFFKNDRDGPITMNSQQVCLLLNAGFNEDTNKDFLNHHLWRDEKLYSNNLQTMNRENISFEEEFSNPLIPPEHQYKNGISSICDIIDQSLAYSFGKGIKPLFYDSKNSLLNYTSLEKSKNSSFTIEKSDPRVVGVDSTGDGKYDLLEISYDINYTGEPNYLSFSVGAGCRDYNTIEGYTDLCTLSKQLGSVTSRGYFDENVKNITLYLPTENFDSSDCCKPDEPGVYSFWVGERSIPEKNFENFKASDFFYDPSGVKSMNPTIVASDHLSEGDYLEHEPYLYQVYNLFVSNYFYLPFSGYKTRFFDQKTFYSGDSGNFSMKVGVQNREYKYNIFDIDSKKFSRKTIDEIELFLLKAGKQTTLGLSSFSQPLEIISGPKKLYNISSGSQKEVQFELNLSELGFITGKNYLIAAADIYNKKMKSSSQGCSSIGSACINAPIPIYLHPYPESLFTNDHYGLLSGRLIMKVQKNLAGSWKDVDTIYDDEVSFGKESNLDLANLWESSGGYTPSTGGSYRVYSSLVDSNGESIESYDGIPLEYLWEFEVEGGSFDNTSCVSDENCSNLSSIYCDGAQIKQDVGKCLASGECSVQTSVVENCSLEDSNFCSGLNYTQKEGVCLDLPEGPTCVFEESVIEDCNKSILCKKDFCDNSSGCFSEDLIPCCGNSICESGENESNCAEDCYTIEGECNFDSDCGEDYGDYGIPYCKEGDVFWNLTSYDCINPNSPESVCSEAIYTPELKESCHKANGKCFNGSCSCIVNRAEDKNGDCCVNSEEINSHALKWLQGESNKSMNEINVAVFNWLKGVSAC